VAIQLQALRTDYARGILEGSPITFEGADYDLASGLERPPWTWEDKGTHRHQLNSWIPLGAGPCHGIVSPNGNGVGERIQLAIVRNPARIIYSNHLVFDSVTIRLTVSSLFLSRIFS